MVKGTSIAGSVFLIGLLIVAAIDLSYISINIGPFGNPDTVRSVTLHQEYYTMDNALGLAGLYLDTGLRYSVYQAMHDLGRKGGGSELWYDSQDSYPNEQALLEALEAPVLEGLNLYTQSDYAFLDTYEVRLPEYTGLDVSNTTGGDLVVKASASSSLWTRRVMQNLDEIELERDPGLEENFGKAYLGLYQEGLKRLGEAKEKFLEALALIDSVKEATLTREQAGSYPEISTEDVFLKALGDAGITASEGQGEEALGAGVQAVLDQLRDEAGDLVVDFEKNASASLEASECGTPQQSQRPDGETTIFITTLSCTFQYEYTLTVNVSVTNPSREYPVFDEGVVLRPLTLFFSAREKSG